MSLRFVRQRLLLAALPLALSACAGLPSVPQEEERLPSPMSQAFDDVIELGGRLSVRYESNGKEEALHGSFAWSQSPAQTVVTLLSPLGQTMAVVEVTPEGAVLRQSGQPARAAPNVNILTAETLGWPLPVAGLREWLQGFAIDANGRQFIATPATPETVTHDGWHLRYANWLDGASPPARSRPKRIDLARHTAQAGPVSIRIVIDTWQTP